MPAPACASVHRAGRLRLHPHPCGRRCRRPMPRRGWSHLRRSPPRHRRASARRIRTPRNASGVRSRKGLMAAMRRAEAPTAAARVPGTARTAAAVHGAAAPAVPLRQLRPRRRPHRSPFPRVRAPCHRPRPRSPWRTCHRGCAIGSSARWRTTEPTSSPVRTWLHRRVVVATLGIMLLLMQRFGAIDVAVPAWPGRRPCRPRAPRRMAPTARCSRRSR